MYKISRQEQDEWALMSHQRACEAIKNGYFKEEIVPVKIRKRRRPRIMDEMNIQAAPACNPSTDFSPLSKKDGTVTVGHASGLNDADLYHHDGRRKG